MKGVHSYATHFTFMLDMLDYEMQVELLIGTLERDSVRESKIHGNESTKSAEIQPKPKQKQHTVCKKKSATIKTVIANKFPTTKAMLQWHRN